MAVWVLLVPIKPQAWFQLSPGAEAAFVTWDLTAPRSSSCVRHGQPGEAAGQVCCLCRPLAGVRDVSKRVSPGCWVLLGDVPSDGFSRSFFPQSLV